MSASPEEKRIQPLSQDELARLQALKTDGMPFAILIVVITFIMVIVTSERYGAFWAVLSLLAGFMTAALTILGSSAASANLQADIDGGIKRLAVARVVKVNHADGQSRYSIEMRTEEEPSCTLHFAPPDHAFFEVEYGERIKVAYAPISKTVISVVAVGCEYELGGEEAALQVAPEQSDTANTRLERRRAQRDTARKLRRELSSEPADRGLPDDIGEFSSEADASIESMPQPAKRRAFQPLDQHDRGRLDTKRMGGCGIVALLCVLGVLLVLVLALAGVKGISGGAGVALVFCVLLGGVLVAVILLKEDGKVQSDLDAGIKIAIAGQISQMRTESSEGGSPYCFITVMIDQSPPEEIAFLVESRLFHALLPGDAVRIVYVPVSKIILHLQTDSYSYSLRQEGA